MIKNNIKYLAILALGLVACEPEFDNPIDEADTYTSGEADFSNYVALGNSLTAGFADNALYITGQENSYPNILATQFALAGGGEFTQPLMSDNTGGALIGGVQQISNRLVLAVGSDGNPGPKTLVGTPTTEITTNLNSSFNNMGIPGAKSYELLASGYGSAAGLATGSANPYFVRFASAPTSTVIADALAQDPSFFSLWIGSNDILLYATAGGAGTDNNETGNIDPTTYMRGDITHNAVFDQAYGGMVNALVAGGRKGVLLNIPSVTSIPFFTTVPFAALSPLNPDFAAQIPTLNQTFAGLNMAFAALGVPERAITFSTTAASPVVIKDESLTDITASLTVAITPAFGPLAPIIAAQYGQARQATAEDLLVLPSSSVIGQPDTDRVAELVGLGVPAELAGQLSVKGVSLPLEDQFVLIPAEQTAIENARVSYNTTIKALADANGLAFVDASAALAQVANGGIPFNGGVVTSQFVSGGGFSLDGVHPTPRGYAIVANLIIDAVNSTYKSNLPKVEPADFGTVTLSNDVAN